MRDELDRTDLSDMAEACEEKAGQRAAALSRTLNCQTLNSY